MDEMDEIINEETAQPPQYYADFDEYGNIAGFYVDEIHGDNIPETALPITFEEWQTYLTGTSRFKFDGDTIREKTPEEIAEEEANRPPLDIPESDAEKIARLEEENEVLLLAVADLNEQLTKTTDENALAIAELYEMVTTGGGA